MAIYKLHIGTRHTRFPLTYWRMGNLMPRDLSLIYRSDGIYRDANLPPSKTVIVRQLNASIPSLIAKTRVTYF